MAIGDTPNQNLFGTNYNAEEEERKKAELAAQNARMGAGNVPASAFGQAPAVAPFSMEAAGQVNPMMQQQNLESFAQPQVTFRDYDVPATPPASALSVFTPGGEVKPNVDVNAITPSPEMTSPNSVNTALNQEVPVDTVNKPGLGNFFFGAPTPEQARKILETQPTSPSQRENLQAIVGGEERPSSVSKGFDYLFGRPDVPGNSNILQTPSAIIDPFTGKTIEKPTPFAYDNDPLEGMTANQQAVMNAIAKTNAQRQEAAQGQASTAPTNGLTTVGGASLSEFLSGQAMPEQGFTEAEPLSGRGVTLTQDQMNELSAEREARLDARLPGDQSVSDRDRRAARGDGISMADQTSMAKANARGATPSEVARGNQVANALGVDLKTGQSLQAAGSLSETERLNREKFLYQQGQDILAGKVLDQKATTARTEAFETSRNNVRSTQDSYEKLKPVAEEIANLSGSKFTEGMLGWTASKLPFSTDAAQIERLTTEFEGSAFLQGLIDAKSKGATFGALSEREGDRILGQWGKITSPKSTNKERISAINSMLGSIQRAAERAQSDHRERFPELFNQTNPSAVQGTGQRYNNDQDHGAAVETHFVG